MREGTPGARGLRERFCARVLTGDFGFRAGVAPALAAGPALDGVHQWSAAGEAGAVDDGSLNQQAQNAGSGGSAPSSWSWPLWNVASFVPEIPLDWAKDLSSHTHKHVRVVKPSFVGRSQHAALDTNLKATWLGHAVRRICASSSLANGHFRASS